MDSNACPDCGLSDGHDPDHACSQPEVMYAIRRTDGSPMFGEFGYATVEGPDDWSLADEDAAGGDGVAGYELVEMAVQVVGRRTLPLCDACEKPGEFWGLCEQHAREDSGDDEVDAVIAARSETEATHHEA